MQIAVIGGGFGGVKAAQEVRPTGVSIGGQFIETATVIWAAGNRASVLLETLNVPLDAAGRGIVRSDLTIPDDPWIFVIGMQPHLRIDRVAPFPAWLPPPCRRPATSQQ